MSIPTLMIRLCVLFAYLALTLPLPLVLLDHQLELLMGNPAQRSTESSRPTTAGRSMAGFSDRTSMLLMPT